MNQLREQHLNDIIEQMPDGCAPNTKRNTGFYFSDQATEIFL